MSHSRPARAAVATFGLLALVSGLAATAPTAGAGSPAPVTPVVGEYDAATGQVWAGLEPGQPGTRCERGFEVRGNDRRLLGCSHGPDQPPPGVDVRDGRSDAEVAADIREGQQDGSTPSEAAADGLNPDGVACIGDGTSGYRVQAIYAVPADRADRSATVVPAIRATYGPRVESQYRRSATETGGEVHVPWVTSADGTSCQLDVKVHVLPTNADDSFSNTISALRSLGYTRSDRKYLVWMDSNVLCGIASIYNDSRPTQDNNNNGYAAMFARADSACWAYAEAHELMHNLGGVQTGAPNATAGFHCTDEPDEMCYDDDGSGPVVMRNVCSGRDGTLFDCNHDDYFRAGTPPSGTWLATHWNTHESRFLHRGALSPTPPPPANVAPSVSAGADRTATVGQAITLDGTVNDDGLPAGGTLTQVWSATGPASPTFGSPALTDTTATFPTAGTYAVTLTANDGGATTADSATITVTSGATGPVTESFSGTLSSKTRSISHSFSSGTGSISATIVGPGGQVKLTAELYDATGRRIASRSGYGTFTFTATSTRRAGVHRLVVKGSSGSYTANVTHPR